MRHVIACLLVLAACGDDGAPAAADAAPRIPCADDPRTDAFALGMIKTGPAGLGVRIDAAEPAPPARFSNAWTVAVLDPAGAPAAGVAIAVQPFMPDHGHGTPVEVVVSELDGGRYRLEPLELWMPGLWEVRLELTGIEPTDRIVFRVCIEE
jgi:hypothetical protein